MKQSCKRAGFTLPELLVSTGIASAIIGALLTGTIALQRGYAAAEYYIGCQIDQMRVIDYITRDVRRATGVATENSGRKLVLTIPDQRDPVTRTLRVPVVSDGTVRYGGAPVPVAYYIEGDIFIREENGVRRAVATRRLENFAVSLSALPMVTFELAFTPRFSRRSGYGQAATTIKTSVPASNAVVSPR